MKFRLVASLTLGVILSSTAFAQEFTRTPLPSNHPLVGTWRIELPEQKCFEEYELRTDGTKLSESGQERNEAEFMISLKPSAKGFYKWMDKITKNNGMPDCSGATTPVGHVAENFIRMHSSGSKFLLCEAEDMSSCFAEFTRKR
ncbi:MAG: hypothetical protein PHS32_20235 [Rhodoferax sp.]|uniref:hypothetical protein n=1 Tax=Rhodoferax sp. TaxID=50421 RepID=UPI0026282C28|nr:hypothetical protein [Rhodoferax sp.]MDD5336071.1 hypothetical protein [Rhodoferax sp.]